MAWDIVIAGGGFGGYYAARTLEKHAAAAQRARHAGQRRELPALHAAAAGRGGRDAGAAPRRRAAARAAEDAPTCGSAASPAPSRSATRCIVDSLDGRRARAALRPADRRARLDLAHAADPRPGRARDRLQDAAGGDRAAQPRAVALEIAETVHDAETRAEYLTFVFVGAGYAGLEGLAELQDFVTDVIDLYPRCRVQGMRWMLVEAKERVMPEVAPTLAAFAERELRGRGIEIRTNTTLEEVDRAPASR